jgi:hypothetical protein
MVDIPTVAPLGPSVSTGGSASAPGSWVNPSPTTSFSATNQIPGSSNILPSGNFQGNFGRLVPFDSNAVYPNPATGGKWTDRVLPPPEGFGQTPDSGGSSQQGGSGDDGGEAKADPAEKEKEDNQRAKGEDITKDEKKKKKLRTASKQLSRPKQKNANHPAKHLGINDLSQEGQGGQNGCKANNDPAGLPDDIVPVLGGIARNIMPQVPAMEQLLQNIPNAVLGNFLGALPPGLQSFIPPGVIPGLGNSGPFSLNGLVGLVGGGALGNAASEIIRSVLPNIGIPPQVAQQLSSVALNQIFPTANISSGTNYAALAQTLSTIQLASGSATNSGIPLNPAMLNQAVVTALNASGLSQVIPTNILGVANSLVQNPIGTIVNAAMGGGNIPPIPIIPSNLSNPSASLLSGLGQFVPPEVAQGIMNVSQLSNILPGNLQNLIPMVSPLMQGGAPNLIQQIANAAPEMVPNSDVIGSLLSGSKPKEKKPTNDGKDSKDVRHIDLAQMVSESFDLFQLSTGTAINPGSNRIHKGDSGPDVDEIIKNLSGLSNNVLEPLRRAFPNMQIHSGYREDSGEHSKGKAVDVAWNVSPTRLMEIADWARKNLPYKELVMEMQKTGWLHIVYEQGSKSQSVSTSSAAGCEKGLVNRKG